MSTATLTPPAVPSAAPAFDAAAFVRGLSPDAQEAVLVELVREVLRVNGPCGPLPIVAADGEFLGCFQSPAAVEAQLARAGPPLAGGQEAVDRYLANPGAVVSFEEMLDRLKEAAADPLALPQLPG